MIGHRLRTIGCVLCLMIGSRSLAQGTAVVLPLSKVVTSAQEVITFQIHSQVNEELRLKVDYFCEVDGVELSSVDCLKNFVLSFDRPLNDQILQLPDSSTSAQGTLTLTNSPQKYAFFKPLFAPVSSAEKRKEGLSFDFKYQPGYLFLIKPDQPSIQSLSYSERITNDAKIAHFELDLSSLTMPHVASISAKIMDKSSRKLIRFVRLASEKILDPKRMKIEMEAPYGAPNLATQTCYELIIQWNSSTSMQKLTSCP